VHQGLQLVALALLLISAASCGARQESSNQSKGGGEVENSTLIKLALTSAAFRDGQPIPTQYTCDGADRIPPLSWDEPPAGTRSFALVVDDPDAPNGTFRHWGVYAIPASARAIGGDETVGSEVGNDFGKVGYGGPCPPPGHGVHHYHFKLFALGVDRLDLGGGAKIGDVEAAAGKQALATGELIGTYERK
jgi:Raf kinase inhibitor-like YbhB/YbcL family protein